MSNIPSIRIQILPGNLPPKYPETIEIYAVEANITEKGMTSGAPLLDLVFKDEHGQRYFYMTSAAIIEAIAAAIQGVKEKNAGRSGH